MTTTRLDLSAVRRVAAGHGDPDQRRQDVDGLAEHIDGNQRVIRALVQGLWDDDREVRRACAQTLRKRLREMDSNSHQLLLEVFLVKLAGDSAPPKQAVSFLSAFVRWIRSHRTEEPHLFTTILTEAERSRRGGSYPRSVRSTLKELYREVPTDDSLTADVVRSFNQQRSLQQLVSETTPPQEVKSSLRTLGDDPLSETDIEVLLYHLVPLRNVRDEGVMVAATRNLEEWVEELPGHDKFELVEAKNELKAYGRGFSDQLSGHLRNEIALSEVAVDFLAEELERLRDLPQYRQPIEHILETLAHIAGVRDVVQVLTDIATEEQGIPQEKAITVLCSLVTALDADIERNRDRVDYVYDDTIAAVDDEIRDFLQELGSMAEGDIDNDVASIAVDELIRSRPDDLTDRLTELLEERSVEDPLVLRAFEAVTDEAILSATEPLLDALDRSMDEDAESARTVIRFLEQLGHDQMRGYLVEMLEQAPDPVQSRARDALVKSGYYQSVREREIRTRSFRLGRRSQATRKRRQSEEAARRDERREHKQAESELRRQIREADRVLRDGLIEILQRRIDSLDTLVELNQENERVERLVDEAAAYHQELGQHLDRLPLGSEVVSGIDEEFASIDQGLTYLDRLADMDQERASELGDRITEIETELDALDRRSELDADEELKQSLLKTEQRTLEELREEYRKAAKKRRGQVSDMRDDLSRKRNDLKHASAGLSGSATDIESIINVAQTRQRRIESLTAQHEQEWDRIDEAVERRASEIADRLNEMSRTVADLESLQRSIDDITKKIDTDQLKQQRQSQRSREDQELYKRIGREVKDEVKETNEQAHAKSEFFKHRRVYTDFVRRYYETELDEIRDGRFREQYDGALRELEAEIREYYD